MINPKQRDLLAEKEAFEERLAICMFDGGLSEAEAMKIADKQLWDGIREFDEKTRKRGN